MTFRLLQPVAWSWVLACVLCTRLVYAEEDYYQVRVDKAFDDVMLELSVAIGEGNFAVVGMNRVGEAIAQMQRTSGPRATVIHICNLEFAAELLAADPAMLIHLPCRIALFEDGDEVVIQARMLPEDNPATQDLIRDMNRRLRQVADYPADRRVPLTNKTTSE